MDAAEILDQLKNAEGLPTAALQAASAQRAEMVPVFLREIQSYLALDSLDRQEPTPLCPHPDSAAEGQAACGPTFPVTRRAGGR